MATTDAGEHTDREPDYRFTLANERTFLAWMRTALGLLAGGVAVRQLIEPFDVSGGRTALALLAIGASAILAVGGFLRWRSVQRAMRHAEPLPAASLVPVLAAGLLVVAVVAFVLVAANVSEPADRGLQPERTALAHVRTVLALVAVAMLVVRQADGGTERIVVALVAAAAVVTATTTSLVRQRELRTTGTVRASTALELGALALAVAVLQGLAVLVVL